MKLLLSDLNIGLHLTKICTKGCDGNTRSQGWLGGEGGGHGHPWLFKFLVIPLIIIVKKLIFM